MFQRICAVVAVIFITGCAAAPGPAPLASLPPLPVIPEGPPLAVAGLSVDSANNASTQVYAFAPIAGLRSDAAPPPAMVTHFINVGQGDATLLEFACGVVLIDAGGDDDDDVARLIDYLDAVFARRPDLNRTIDLLMLTHAHIDHTRAFDALLDRFTIERYVDNGRNTGSGIPQVKRLKKVAMEKDIAIREVTDSEIAALPHRRGLTDDLIDPIACPACDPRISILSSSKATRPSGWSAGQFIDQNHHSMVIRVDFGETSMLFTGDLEIAAIATLLDRYRGSDALDVDVYHAGHHGQHDGTTPELVAAMSPDLTIISCGDPAATLDPISAFAYGNPRNGVIEMLTQGLSRDRAAPGTFAVGKAGWRFADQNIQRAIYATPWDGHIALIAHQDGAFRVIRHHTP